MKMLIEITPLDIEAIRVASQTAKIEPISSSRFDDVEASRRTTATRVRLSKLYQQLHLEINKDDSR